MPDETRSSDPTSSPGEGGGRPFTTHPTGDALAKDLRDVRSKPERAFNVGAALGLTLAVATFIFLIQNNGPTDFEWLWFDFELPLWAALVGALVTGALLILTALAVHRRRRKRIGRRERAAGRLEQALVGGEAEAPAPAGSERPSPSVPPSRGDETRSSDATDPPASSSGSSGGSEPPLRRPPGPQQVRGPMQG